MGTIRDLTGLRFGKLTFLERLYVDERRRSVWSARCECGNVTNVVGTRVTGGHVSSCGCSAVNVPSDLTGKKFGRLTALSVIGRHQSRALLWKCRCDCGVVVEVPSNKLKLGHTRSCGCLQLDGVSTLNLTHGMSHTPTYSTWLAMWARCTNPRALNYPNYGGRGISVCRRWESFENFFTDMGEKPEGLSIERVDNDAGYNPKNCIWADRLTQNRNQRPRKDRLAKKGIT